jgi:hypothetical protein
MTQNVAFLGMSPLEFVIIPDPVFLATIRAHPLEGLALIDQGGEEEREIGNERIPDDVWAETYAHLLGFKTSEYLSFDADDRGLYLDIEPEVTRIEIAKLTQAQVEEYIILITTGVRRRDALAEVMAAETKSAA